MAEKASSAGRSTGRYVTKANVARQPRTTVRESKNGEFTVALPSKSVQALNPRKSGVRAVMEVLSERITESRESGRRTGFWVEVDPKGQPRVHAKATIADDAKQAGNDRADDADDLDAALAAARERGRLRVAEILAGDEILSADAFAASGSSRWSSSVGAGD